MLRPSHSRLQTHLVHSATVTAGGLASSGWSEIAVVGKITDMTYEGKNDSSPARALEAVSGPRFRN
jgi:hypothetical protein